MRRGDGCLVQPKLVAIFILLYKKEFHIERIFLILVYPKYPFVQLKF
jgi:hypothetical protein